LLGRETPLKVYGNLNFNIRSLMFQKIVIDQEIKELISIIIEQFINNEQLEHYFPNSS